MKFRSIPIPAKGRNEHFKNVSLSAFGTSSISSSYGGGDVPPPPTGGSSWLESYFSDNGEYISLTKEIRIDQYPLAKRDLTQISNGSAYWDATLEIFKSRSAAFDSDKLGGVAAANFLRSDVSDTMNGSLTVLGSGTFGSYVRVADGINLRQTGATGDVGVLENRKDGGLLIYGGSFAGGSAPLRIAEACTTYTTVNTSLSVGKNAAPTEALDVFGNGIFSGNITAGSTAKASDTAIRVISDSNHKAGFEAYGASQGTGYLYVGQSITYGGGIEYNGDGSPVTTGAGADYISLYRRVNGNDFWTARNQYNNNNWEFRGDITAGGSGTFGSDIKSSDYSGLGFAGQGWGMDAGVENHLTVDRLTVRGRMDIYELVINQIRATNGSLWISDSMKITTFSNPALNIYVFSYHEDTNFTFLEGDVIKAQQFDGRNVRTFVGRVGFFDAALKTFNVTRLSGSEPWEGMELVRVDSILPNRDGALYLTSSDSGSPYMDVTKGDGNGNFSSRLRVGKLNGVGQETGYGIWGSTDGTTSNFVISSDGYAKIAGWSIEADAIAHNDNNSFVGMISSISNSAIIGGTNSLLRRGFGMYNFDGAMPTVAGVKVIRIGALANKDSAGSFPAIPNLGIQIGTGKGGSYKDVFRVDDEGALIAGWQFDYQNIRSANNRLHLSNEHNRISLTQANSLDASYGPRVQMYYNADDDWGLWGSDDGVHANFRLGSTNQIAGINFDNSRLYTDRWTLNKDGSGSFAGGQISWDSAGALEVDGGVITGLIQSSNWSEDNNTGSKFDLVSGSINFANIIRITTNQQNQSDNNIQIMDGDRVGTKLGNFALSGLTSTGGLSGRVISTAATTFNPPTGGFSLTGARYVTTSGALTTSAVPATNPLSSGSTYMFSVKFKMRFFKNTLISTTPIESGLQAMDGYLGSVMVTTCILNESTGAEIARIFNMVKAGYLENYEVSGAFVAPGNVAVRIKIELSATSISYNEYEMDAIPIAVHRVSNVRATIEGQSGSWVEVKGSSAVTEVSTHGFQSIWGSEKYFRISDKLGEPAFIQSAGSWIHTGSFKGLNIQPRIFKSISSNYTITADDIANYQVFQFSSSTGTNYITLPTLGTMSTAFGNNMNAVGLSIIIICDRYSVTNIQPRGYYHWDGGTSTNGDVPMVKGDVLMFIWLGDHWQITSRSQ